LWLVFLYLGATVQQQQQQRPGRREVKVAAFARNDIPCDITIRNHTPFHPQISNGISINISQLDYLRDYSQAQVATTKEITLMPL